MPRRAHIDIRNTTHCPVPRVSFERIARSILGPRYELSLVICGDALARRMNQTYRKKDYSPNVLSFSYASDEGEIFLNVRKAQREARAMRTTVRARIALLFIHGCFHLKGLRHGVTMEKLEEKSLREFNML